MVGVGGLEPPASWSRTKRATSCATPRQPSYYISNPPGCQVLFHAGCPFENAINKSNKGKSLVTLIFLSQSEVKKP